MGRDDASDTEIPPFRADPREEEIRLLKGQLDQSRSTLESKESLLRDWRARYEALEERMRNSAFDRWTNRLFKMVARILWLFIGVVIASYPLLRWWMGNPIQKEEDAALLVVAGLIVVATFVAHAHLQDT